MHDFTNVILAYDLKESIKMLEEIGYEDWQDQSFVEKKFFGLFSEIYPKYPDEPMCKLFNTKYFRVQMPMPMNEWEAE